MASSVMGAWVPSATTAVQERAWSADSFLHGLEEEGQWTAAGGIGDDQAEGSAGEVERSDPGAHEGADLFERQDLARAPRVVVTVLPPGARAFPGETLQGRRDLGDERVSVRPASATC